MPVEWEMFHSERKVLKVVLVKQGPLLVLICLGSPRVAKHCKKWLRACLVFSPAWAVAQKACEHVSTDTKTNLSLPKEG